MMLPLEVVCRRLFFRHDMVEFERRKLGIKKLEGSAACEEYYGPVARLGGLVPVWTGHS